MIHIQSAILIAVAAVVLIALVGDAYDSWRNR